MSTSVLYPNPAVEWKQEVSQRLAAHRRRRGLPAPKPSDQAFSWELSTSRGSLVAARVAARYAHAPSYSELQAIDAPPAATAVSPAPQAAPKPIAVAPPLPALVEQRKITADNEVFARVTPMESSADFAIEEHFSARSPERTSYSAASLTSAPPPESLDAWESEYAPFAWHPDPRLSPLGSDLVRSPRPSLMDEFYGPQEPVSVEPDLPIHANLIEFPREVVAARKMRPRRAERSAAESMERQLSIFEVDPGILPDAALEEAKTTHIAWSQPEWAGIRLEAQTQSDLKPEELPLDEEDLHLASAGHRLMAVLVDSALVTAAFVVLATVVTVGAGTLPAPKILAFSAAATLLLLGLCYQTGFLLLAGATPGMRYAGTSLCTFDGQIPTPEELRSRLGALLLSVAPAGLGVAWALLDEDHLCWHDRLSRTYLRNE